MLPKKDQVKSSQAKAYKANKEIAQRMSCAVPCLAKMRPQAKWGSFLPSYLTNPKTKAQMHRMHASPSVIGLIKVDSRISRSTVVVPVRICCRSPALQGRGTRPGGGAGGAEQRRAGCARRRSRSGCAGRCRGGGDRMFEAPLGPRGAAAVGARRRRVRRA